MIKYSEVKSDLLKNPRVRRAYSELQPQFDLARQFIEARVAAGLTQGQVAHRMGTTQSVVARLESGRYKPGLNTLLRFAKAVGACRLTFDFSDVPRQRSNNLEIRLRA
jgi:transcriptional regulator with XRE-family HTH domain